MAGRLPQELRLAGITTMEGANAFPRGTLADSAVFIHQHLDESISIRYGRRAGYDCCNFFQQNPKQN